MSEFNIHVIEQAIIDFMINVTNLFVKDKVYSFEFASREIKNELMSNGEHFVDFRGDLENNVHRLMSMIVSQDYSEFVSTLAELTFLTEPLLRLDDIGDNDKIQKVINYTEMCYNVCFEELENFNYHLHSISK